MRQKGRLKGADNFLMKFLQSLTLTSDHKVLKRIEEPTVPTEGGWGGAQ